MFFVAAYVFMKTGFQLGCQHLTSNNLLADGDGIGGYKVDHDYQGTPNRCKKQYHFA